MDDVRRPIELRVPPRLTPAPPPAGRWLLPLAGIILIGAGMFLYRFNPAEHAFYPVCFFHEWTGWHCPGCGASRALYSLVHGRCLAALRFNPLFVLLLPWLAWAAGRRVIAYSLGRAWAPVRMPAAVVTGLVVTVLLFGVLRNLPWRPFIWLAPP